MTSDVSARLLNDKCCHLKIREYKNFNFDNTANVILYGIIKDYIRHFPRLIDNRKLY